MLGEFIIRIIIERTPNKTISSYYVQVLYVYFVPYYLKRFVYKQFKYISVLLII